MLRALATSTGFLLKTLTPIRVRTFFHLEWEVISCSCCKTFAFIPKLIGIIVGFFKNNPIGQIITNLIKTAINILLLPFKLIAAPFIFIINFIKGFIKGFKETEGNFFQKLLGGLLGGVKGIWEVIKKFIGGLIAPFVNIFNIIKPLIGKIIDFFKNNDIGKVLSLVIKIIFYPITLVIQVIKGIINFVKGFIKGFKETEGGFFQKLLGGLFGGLKGVWEGIKKFFAGIWNAIKSIPEAIGKIIKAVVNFFQNNKFGRVLGTIFKIIFWPFTLIIKAVKGIINLFKRDKPEGEAKKIGVLGKIFGFLWKVISWPFRMIILGVKAIINIIGRVIGKIKGFFKFTLIKTFIEGFKGTEGGFFQKIIGGLKHIGDKIKGWFANLIPQFIKDFFERLRSGDETYTAMTAVRDVIDRIVGFFHRIARFFADFKPSDAFFDKAAYEKGQTWYIGRDATVNALEAIGGGLQAIGLQKGAIVTKPTLAMLAEGGKPEGVFPLPNRPASQLSALSGQLAVQAAGGMSGGGTGGDTNVTTVAPVTNNNTEIYRTEPGVVESTLSKINQDHHHY